MNKKVASYFGNGCWMTCTLPTQDASQHLHS